jgi:hypothetical protein
VLRVLGGRWKALNPEALKEEFKVAAVFKNGPRFWVVHKTFVLKAGKMSTDKRDFGGIEAFYAATVKLPPDFRKGLVAYQEGAIARDTPYMFSKGKPVFLLIDPNGGTWVMQAYSHIVDNSLTLESLSTLDRKLKLPQGWQYRVKILDRDLTVQPVNGVARIVQDDLQSTYNLCVETACSYDPK